MHGKLVFHEPEENTRHQHTQFPLCLHKTPTIFSLQQTVCELFTDGAAAHVRSSVHTYAHLVRMCVPGFTYLVL